MIGHYVALIKRELWEHRSIFVTPIVIASVVTLGTLTALVFVGEDEREAREGAEAILWYMSANKVPVHWTNPPGYHPPAVAAQVMRP